MPVRERGQGEPTPGQHVPFSGHVQAHTPGERRAFAPAATEDTGERDSPLEGERFELSVPLDRDDGFGLSSPARLLPERDPTVRNPLAPPQNLPYDAARGFTDWCRRTAEAMAKTRPP